MKFEWKLRKKSKLTFNDKIHNLACFETVLNIMRMRIKSDLETFEEMEALCGFALECMFGDSVQDDKLFNKVMDLKDEKVNKFKSKLLQEMGVPGDVMHAPEIGEA